MKSNRPHIVKAVPLAQMRINPLAQRELTGGRVEQLAADFNPDALGHPTVNQRGAIYNVVDGQTRIEALKRFLGDWKDQKVECIVYADLSDQEEAELFLELNNTRVVKAYAKFMVGVTAKRAAEIEVLRAVEKCGLAISHANSDNAVSAVSTLMRVHDRSDTRTLMRALTITHRAFGAPGLTAPVIDGVAYVCQRYNGKLDDESAIERLNSMRGGVGALMAAADVLKKQTHKPLPQCVAAAIVDSLNRKRGGNKLPTWWNEGAS